MKLEIIDEKFLKEINIDQDNIKEVYTYKNNEQIIGLVIIKNSEENMLSFNIFDKYQGLGYGKKMMKEALNLLKEKGYEELKFTVDRSNIKAIKIITSLGGKHLSNVNNLSRYIINL